MNLNTIYSNTLQLVDNPAVIEAIYKEKEPYLSDENKLRRYFAIRPPFIFTFIHFCNGQFHIGSWVKYFIFFSLCHTFNVTQFLNMIYSVNLKKIILFKLSNLTLIQAIYKEKESVLSF